MKRSFHRVWLKQDYTPANKRTVYFLNHNSWWDGLIPLYLNENHFHQQARALMEDKQMREYSFFSRIGAFSINPEDPRSAVTSLRYACNSMKREKASLFIYPEGELKPAGDARPEFKEGLAWLWSHTRDVDFVPVALYMPAFRHHKPELYIHTGDTVTPDEHMNTQEVTRTFEHALHAVLSVTRETAGKGDEGFTRVM